MVKLTFEKARSVVKELVRKNEVILILGEPGIGKSAMVEQVSQELGYEVYYFNLNYLTRSDLIMLTINEKGEPEYHIAKHLDKIISNENNILFLDEFNMNMEMQTILLEITLKKELFGKKINSRIILAGNDSYNDLAMQIITPLETRIFKIKLVSNFEEWVKYIKNKYKLNQNQAIYLTFLEHEKDIFLNNERALNPRVHESIVRYLEEFKEIEEETIIAGWAGETIAEKYLMFKKEILPIAGKNPKEILESWKNLKNGQRIYIINKMIENLSEKELIEFIENVEEEWGVMILRKFVAHKKDENEKILTLNRLLKKLPKLNKFLSELINS